MKILTTLALISIGATPVLASDYKSAMQDFHGSKLAEWAANPMVVSAINAQNTVTEGYDLAQIERLDQAWRAEVGEAATPTISPVLDNVTSDFLRDQVAASGGSITEVFMMDAKGLNVAASDTTSDYWQGDEKKFSLTYILGADAIHYSEVEFDESTQMYQAQISFTIVDPATGQAIGAMTVGVDADALVN